MIGELVAKLIAAGTPPELAAMVVTEAFAAGAAVVIPRNSGGIPVDETAEKRRAYDRKRKNKSTGIPPDSTGIPPETENALSLSKKESKQEGKEVRGAPKARASQLPDDWKPGETAWQDAVARLGQTRAVAELQKFKNHAADKGRVSKNWDAAWRNWVDRALDYGGGMGTKGNGNGRRTVHDAARDLSANVAARLRELDEPAPELCDAAGRAPFRLLPSR